MTEKFTAAQWAEMEGGHEVTPEAETSFSFLKDIHEARMTRNENNVAKLSYTDCCERVYLSLLILELLRSYPAQSNAAKSYAKKTISYSNYNSYKINGTDLYNLIYFVVGDDSAMEKLKDPEAAKAVRKRTTLPQMAVNRYLSQIGNGTLPTRPAELFIKLESSLNITNSEYKNIRRAITNLDRIDRIALKTAVTKLLYAVRARLRSSDLIDDLEKLAAIKDLESSKVRDTEPTISTPDTEVIGTDLVYLAQLVGRKRLFLATKFIELSSQGKTIPSNITQAFDPVVEMIVDIIKAGPAHVSMLKTVHNRAKKALKK